MSERAFVYCKNCNFQYTYSFSDECKTGEQAKAVTEVEDWGKKHRQETGHRVEVGKTTSKKAVVIGS